MSDLPQFTNYVVLERVGQGGYGAVFHAAERDSNPLREVAIKVIDIESVDASFTSIVGEITVLSQIRHPHITAYYGCFGVKRSSCICVVEEWVDGASLEELLELQVILSEPALCMIAIDMLRALTYLHENCRIVHRDVKSSNILVNRNGATKLVDLGACAQVDSGDTSRKTVIGTPAWMAPEILARMRSDDRDGLFGDDYAALGITHEQEDRSATGYGSKADVWSLGITLLQNLLGTVPRMPLIRQLTQSLGPGSAAYTDDEIFAASIQALPTVLRDACGRVSPGFVRLVLTMLTVDPEKRPKAVDLVNTDFLTRQAKSLLLGADNNCPGRIALRLAVEAMPQTVKLPERDELDVSLDCEPAERTASPDYLQATSRPKKILPKDPAKVLQIHHPKQPPPHILAGEWSVMDPIGNALHDQQLSPGGAVAGAGPVRRFIGSKHETENLPVSGYACGTRFDPSKNTSHLFTNENTIPVFPPFGDLYQKVLQKSLHGAGAGGPAVESFALDDAGAHRRVIASLSAAFAKCETTIPNFSALFLQEVLFRAQTDPFASAQLEFALSRGSLPNSYITSSGVRTHITSNSDQSLPSHYKLQSSIVPPPPRFADPLQQIEELVVVPKNDDTVDPVAYLFTKWKSQNAREKSVQWC